ncbi:hypothetical protein [Nocardioides piscis]|uniref:Uncharacterized protein n=1 Tax=Nocardioides piscis TaxID=2714938 RepID=A0A6G7YHD0_9ACTN|nr:hypothetical protein [Nocardioides piscis]QIK76041.1 hypothetical protein G7071_11955 [Nocardioides piscis]
MDDEPKEDDPLRSNGTHDSELSETRRAAWALHRDLLAMADKADTPEYMRAGLLERARAAQATYDGLEQFWRWKHEQEQNVLMLKVAEASNHLARQSNTTAKALKNWTVVLAGATVILAVATVALIFATLAA